MDFRLKAQTFRRSSSKDKPPPRTRPGTQRPSLHRQSRITSKLCRSIWFAAVSSLRRTQRAHPQSRSSTRFSRANIFPIEDPLGKRFEVNTFRARRVAKLSALCDTSNTRSRRTNDEHGRVLLQLRSNSARDFAAICAAREPAGANDSRAAESGWTSAKSDLRARQRSGCFQRAHDGTGARAVGCGASLLDDPVGGLCDCWR